MKPTIPFPTLNRSLHRVKMERAPFTIGRHRLGIFLDRSCLLGSIDLGSCQELPLDLQLKVGGDEYGLLPLQLQLSPLNGVLPPVNACPPLQQFVMTPTLLLSTSPIMVELFTIAVDSP